ncbi:hypothetical protein [Nostoc sp.]|uniref:hypothetical protein n=1 Tax=Nostoc sp. TaxID=1180 RepID=UPI002FFC62CD
MILLTRFNSAFKLRAAFFLLLSLTLVSGCGEHDRTTLKWHPAAPIGIALKREAKGLWNFSTSVPLPIDNLGVFSIDHEFDFRDDYTYIIIRNQKKGTEQVFKLGVDKGKVKLHLTGTHDLTLQPEKDNKIIVDDDALSGTMTVQIYQNGQKLANISFENGTEFVFLTDNRLHIEYPSLYHAIQHERFNIDSSSIFRKDDSISLNSVEKVTFKRDMQVCQLIFDWKPEIKANQQPLLIELPKKGKSTIKNIQELQNTLTILAPKVQFNNDYSSPNAVSFSICVLGYLLLFVLTFYYSKKGHFLKVIGLMILLVLLIIPLLIMLFSDRDYIEFQAEIHSKKALSIPTESSLLSN